MIAADDLLRRVNGTEVTFSVDLGMVEPPVKRVNSTMAGRQRNITKAQYQYPYNRAIVQPLPTDQFRPGVGGDGCPVGTLQKS